MGNGTATLSCTQQELHDPSEVLASKLAHGFNLFALSAAARYSFITFVKQGSWIEKMHNYMNCSDSALKDILEEEFPADFLEPGPSICCTSLQEFLLPNNIDFDFVSRQILLETHHKPMQKITNLRPTNCSTNQQISLNQVQAALLATIFPIYLESASYDTFIQRQILGTDYANPITTAMREQRLDSLFAARPGFVQDTIASALVTMDPEELPHLRHASRWLSNLLAMVEDLPVSVTVACARSERRGFPLVYANQAFEKLTGYSRQEMMGRNCRFLQHRYSAADHRSNNDDENDEDDDQNADEIAVLCDALRTAQATQVLLRNRRRDGQVFMNCLALRPIFDTHGIYSYVVAVQAEVSSQTSLNTATHSWIESDADFDCTADEQSDTTDDVLDASAGVRIGNDEKDVWEKVQDLLSILPHIIQ